MMKKLKPKVIIANGSAIISFTISLYAIVYCLHNLMVGMGKVINNLEYYLIIAILPIAFIYYFIISYYIRRDDRYSGSVLVSTLFSYILLIIAHYIIINKYINIPITLKQLIELCVTTFIGNLVGLLFGSIKHKQKLVEYAAKYGENFDELSDKSAKDLHKLHKAKTKEIKKLNSIEYIECSVCGTRVVKNSKECPFCKQLLK